MVRGWLAACAPCAVQAKHDAPRTLVNAMLWRNDVRQQCTLVDSYVSIKHRWEKNVLYAGNKKTTHKSQHFNHFFFLTISYIYIQLFFFSIIRWTKAFLVYLCSIIIHKHITLQFRLNSIQFFFIYIIIATQFRYVQLKYIFFHLSRNNIFKNNN